VDRTFPGPEPTSGLCPSASTFGARSFVMGIAIPANTGSAAGSSIHILQKIAHDEKVLAKHKMLILKCQVEEGDQRIKPGDTKA
jgi:hypothetical protein